MFTTPLRAAALCALAAISLSSCFGIIDKDRRKIAMLNGKAITRGDFNKVLRDMSPETRPNIRTKGDVRSALQNYLDKEVRKKNAEDLVAATRITIPRQKAEVILKGTKVDGVYDKDPKKHADAKRYDRVTYDEVLQQHLGVMDASAIALARDNNLPIIVFSLDEPGGLRGILAGRGTYTMHFAQYEDVPKAIGDELVARVTGMTKR